MKMRRIIARNGAGGRVGFEINAYRADPLMRGDRLLEKLCQATPELI